MSDQSWIFDVLGLRQILDQAGVPLPKRKEVQFTTTPVSDGGNATVIPSRPKGAVGSTGAVGEAGYSPPGERGPGFFPRMKVTTYNSGGGTHVTDASTRFGFVIGAGAGGAGGGIESGEGRYCTGGGGGGGATVIRIYTVWTVALRPTVNYSVGSGGAPSINSDGATGAQTAFSSGGDLTSFANGGGGGSRGPRAGESQSTSGSHVSEYGSGGSCSNADILVPGSPGRLGQFGHIIVSGAGGDSWLGKGGRSIQTVGSGKSGLSYGAGGSGAASNDNSSYSESRLGGYGANGVVIMIEMA